MIFNFDFYKFINYYKNLPINNQASKNLIVFSKKYNTYQGLTIDYIWETNSILSNNI